MANHCEPGYLSVVRPVCDFTDTGTECYFQVLVWSIMVKEVELPYTLNNLTPLELLQPCLQILSFGQNSTAWLD